jgi:hypothetical protein
MATEVATVMVMVVGEVMVLREPVRSWLHRHGLPVALIVTMTVTVIMIMVVVIR